MSAEHLLLAVKDLGLPLVISSPEGYLAATGEVTSEAVATRAGHSVVEARRVLAVLHEFLSPNSLVMYALGEELGVGDLLGSSVADISLEGVHLVLTGTQRDATLVVSCEEMSLLASL